MTVDPDLYLRVRRKEGRVYTDEIVARLPELPSGHPLQAEWLLRAASAERLTRYLARLQRPMTVLELGCGNGWLTNRIASVPGTQVVGLERNRLELSQAARVFAGNECLSWLEADIHCAPFVGRPFDAIVVACAIQYFADL